jgi:D-3-phosphoglycerate dehydrogenase
MKILHLDTNHPILITTLAELGHTNFEDYSNSKATVESIIDQFDGLIIRSRFTIDQAFIDKAKHLKFIGRVGAGLENIDVSYAKSKGIRLLSAPEGNRNAVGEHTLGLLLSLFNKLKQADASIRSGNWLREAHRGIEVDGKTIGIIGYGHMGKAFAKKLQGFDAKVLCYDIKPNVGDQYALQVDLETLQRQAHVVSLHVPHTALTQNMINTRFIEQFHHSFWLLNTARGSCVVTKDLVQALESKQILGAGLDVLEYEKSSFETIFSDPQRPEEFEQLMQFKNVLVSPHVAGWTVESHQKLAQTIIDKIITYYHK